MKGDHLDVAVDLAGGGLLRYEAPMARIDPYEARRTFRAVRRLRPDPVPDAVLVGPLP